MGKIYNSIRYGVNYLRGRLYGLFFRSIGSKVRISTGVLINGPRNISIGNNSYISRNCELEGRNGITIGDNVKIASGVKMYAPGPINIGNNVWLCVNVVITKGITIGENSIIGANSLVNKDIPANVLACGVPCKVIKQLDKRKN